MDDGRAVLYRFKPGWRWFDNSVKYCERWRIEDEGKTGLEITKNILAGTMAGIEQFLEFTMETALDFDGIWLPSLDTNLRVDEMNCIQYKYYEKPMACNTVLNSRTAMGEDSKIRSLTNELI